MRVHERRCAVTPADEDADRAGRRERLLLLKRLEATRRDAPESNEARAAGETAGGADESVCPNAAVRLHESESRNARHLEVSRMYLELAEDEDVAVKPRSRARSGPEL